MYVDLKQLKKLSQLKKDIKESEREKKILKEEIALERQEHFKPITDPIKDLTKQIVMLPPPPVLPAITAGVAPAIAPPVQKAITSKPTPPYSTLRLGKLADKYLKTPNNQYDNAYGILPIEGSSKFKLGRSKVKIDGDDLEIDSRKYRGSDGLWKLLTLRHPPTVPQDDYEIYKEIMVQTQAFLDDSGRVKSNKGDKYKSLVKPIYDEWRERHITRRESLGPEEDLTSLTHRMRSISLSEGATGSGVSVSVFLPSDPNELLQGHELLLG